MMKTRFVCLTILVILVLSLFSACGAKTDTGSLELKANGEDFVREGFVSKDGWHIRFDHVYVTLAEVEAYQTDPPYDPHEAGAPQATATVRLDGTFTVDLAEGDEQAEPLLVGAVPDAPAGHYNALHWKMVRADSGPAAGYALVITGAAEKDGQTIQFTVRIEREYEYTCGDYVGDERKGFVSKDGTADLEMTFHFDHVFGDAGTPADDELNVDAPGFAPFAAISRDGSLDIDLAGLEAELGSTEYQMLVEILPTLGHVGEGHCHSEDH